MNIAVRKLRMTREAFFDWAEAQDLRYEYNGTEAVAMTGGTRKHSRLCQNLWFALRTRLNGTGFEVLGPDAGLATIGNAVRYPDALVTNTPGPGEDRVVPGAIVVFEVVSSTSERTDRFVKLLEYRAVESIRRYVIVESNFAGASVYVRCAPEAEWRATVVAAVAGSLELPELGVTLPLAELYDGVDFGAADPDGTAGS
jgi:Uma2 family endonuclease